MGFLDNVLNGLGDDPAGGLGDLLKGKRGVGGLAKKFGQAGLGDVVGSWVGKGALGSGRWPTLPKSWACRPNRPARPWPASCPKPSTA